MYQPLCMKANSEPIRADDVPAAEEPGVALPGDTGGLPGDVSPHEEDTFPIVGIGASAGGLEALEQFLKGVPPDSGMAFVVVQHLDPTHTGMLPELLQRVTPMPVVQVAETVAVRPDTVYVIPPGHDLALLHRNLHLLEPHAPRGLRLPIDFLFRSLADDLHEKSIGVVLSGTGSDGTLGLRAIKEKAGLVLVQEPASAKFNGMPQSAIGTGLADIVAPVITFTEITAFRELERDLSEARTYAEAIVATVREPLLVLDDAMHVVSANRSFYETFRVPAGEVEGRELYSLGNGEWDVPELRQLLEAVLPANEAFNDFRVDHVFPGIGRRVLLLNARRVISEGENKELVLLAFEDVTGTGREGAP